MATLIPVPLPQNPYQIVIAANSIANVGQHLKPLQLGKEILLVSNPEIFDFYGQIVQESLLQAGYSVIVHFIPAGESYKTLDSIAQIYDKAVKNRLERSSTFVALGGGVIGDMTGFAAATWLRGVHFVQIPTTLLAMVDAAIGGKTGVNHPQGKNLIGAFYQPRLVYIDPLVLKTLPEREFRAGMAEVIKYGVIWDQDLFEQLETTADLSYLEALPDRLLETIITRSCQAKVDVVTQDEKEAGLRAILNYGHTLGHAVESLTGYSQINHGEAVGIGMVAAGEIAVKMGLWSQTDCDRTLSLIEKTGLPTKIPTELKLEAILNTLQTDKKVKAGKVRFILPTAIGEVMVSDDVTSEILESVLGSKDNG